MAKMSNVTNVNSKPIPGMVHQILSPISNSESTNFFNEYYSFFNWQTEKKKPSFEPIRSLFSFSISRSPPTNNQYES